MYNNLNKFLMHNNFSVEDKKSDIQMENIDNADAKN